MSHFTTRKIFLTPSFNLNVEEQEKLLKFLLFLENSNVSTIINKYIKNNKGKGGRPNVNYYNLFATIIYGFALSKKEDLFAWWVPLLVLVDVILVGGISFHVLTMFIPLKKKKIIDGKEEKQDINPNANKKSIKKR